MKKYKSFSLIETIVCIGIIIFLFLSYFEINNIYLIKRGELTIRKESLELTNTIIEILKTKISENTITLDFSFSNNSPLSNIYGDGFTSFSKIDDFANIYEIELDNIFRNRNYWILCSKNNLDYANSNITCLRVYIFKKNKEKWIATNLLRIIN